MTKMFASLLLLLLTSTFSHAQKYKYESREDGERIKTVIFANESSIKIEKNSSDGMASMVAIDKNQKIIYGLNEVSDGNVNITAAYPNNLNAEVAIIESNCGGSMCSWNRVYAAYIYNNKLRVDFISDNHEKDFRINIDLTIQNNPKIIAINAPEYTFNKYGDMLKGTRELINGKGAISSTFQRDWLVFVGKHAEDFFADVSKRDSFAKSIGYDNFRTLRSYMTGPGSTTISDGKYLVMNGCMAHFCPNYSATLLIDTSSSKIWAIWVDSEKKVVKSGTNNKWEKEVAQRLISLMNYNESLRIIYKDGDFRVMKIK